MPFKRLQRTFKEFGRKEGSLYLLAHLLARASGGRVRLLRYHLVAQPVNPENTAPRPSAATPVRQVGPDDALCAFFPRPAAVIAQRFASGATCLAAEQRGRFAGFIWLARNAYDEDEVRCRYVLTDPARCAWDFDVYVEPDLRLGRCFARLWDAANSHLAAQGVCWSMSRISAFNPGSQAAHRRMGIHRLGTASFVVAGPLQITVLDRAPFLHISLTAAQAPVLRLAAPTCDDNPPLAASHSSAHTQQS